MARGYRDSAIWLIGLVLVGWAASPKRKRSPASTWKPWTDDEAGAFLDAMLPTGVPINALLMVYTAESGLNPHATSGIAWGLCQAIESTLRGVGWGKPASEFGKLDVTAQAPWIARIVQSQIRMIGFVPKNALDLYVANFSPLAARNNADVIYRAPSANYEKNRNLDRKGKGYIDRADLAAALERAKLSEAYGTTERQIARMTSKASEA
jgi:hypothetical protein